MRNRNILKHTLLATTAAVVLGAATSALAVPPTGAIVVGNFLGNATSGAYGFTQTGVKLYVWDTSTSGSYLVTNACYINNFLPYGQSLYVAWSAATHVNATAASTTVTTGGGVSTGGVCNGGIAAVAFIPQYSTAIAPSTTATPSSTVTSTTSTSSVCTSTSGCFVLYNTTATAPSTTLATAPGITLLAPTTAYQMLSLMLVGDGTATTTGSVNTGAITTATATAWGVPTTAMYGATPAAPIFGASNGAATTTGIPAVVAGYGYKALDLLKKYKISVKPEYREYAKSDEAHAKN
jgi:hypothetical protein